MANGDEQDRLVAELRRAVNDLVAFETAADAARDRRNVAIIGLLALGMKPPHVAGLDLGLTPAERQVAGVSEANVRVTAKIARQVQRAQAVIADEDD